MVRIANKTPHKTNLDKQVMHVPSLSIAEKYIEQVVADKKYCAYKCILSDLFTRHYPNNVNFEQVLLKCTILNDFYLTNIIDTFTVAKHIIEVRDIDKRLKNGDLSLIDEISEVNFKNVTKKFYSFATKFCHSHQPDSYPIYDKNVDIALWYFAEKGYISLDFKRKELRDYKTFKEIVDNFRDSNKLNILNYEKLDNYLWKFGKDLTDKK